MGDYTKVDRSAAYAARWVAKSLVKAGLCRRCLVQVSYAIGVAEPLSITVMDYGTSNKSQQELTEIVRKNFDLRPGKIVKDLNLRTFRSSRIQLGEAKTPRILRRMSQKLKS